MDTLYIPYSNDESEEKSTVLKCVDCEYISTFNEPHVSYIADLWEDKGIQEAYERRREFHLTDSAK
jgi:hypothetical protein